MSHLQVDLVANPEGVVGAMQGQVVPGNGVQELGQQRSLILVLVLGRNQAGAREQKVRSVAHGGCCYDSARLLRCLNYLFNSIEGIEDENRLLLLFRLLRTLKLYYCTN